MLPGVGDQEFASLGAAAYHAGLDVMVVNRINDGATLAYDTDTDAWSEAVAGGEPPSPDSWEMPPCEPKPSACRYGYQMIYDAESNLMVTFGGAEWGRMDAGRHAGLSDTWTFDAAANAWIDQTSDVAPPPRVWHTTAYDTQSDRVIVFGGATKHGGEVMGDTWAYDTNTNTWQEMHPAVSPPARADAMTWYDPEADLVFVYGGTGDWSSWPPLPWLVFGGEELWAYDYESDSWTLYRTNPNPGYRLSGTTVFDPRSGEAVLTGGDHYDAERRFQGWAGDVWVYRHQPNRN
ncbi:MAG: hypothetical protein HKN80_05390 [Acidimicrobiia bacterium]|nr:hypothetical protein [Acidimicrobiia bacterium]